MEEKKYTVDWFSNNIPSWEFIFNHSNLKDKDNLNFLEIGCFEGRATNYLLENILTGKNSKIHVIDTFEGSVNEVGMVGINNELDLGLNELYQKFTHNVSKYKNKVKIYQGLSSNILRNTFKNEFFDFAYVDGSHTAYDVLEDAVLLHKLIKPGGVIIFDDYLWQDPNDTRITNSPKLAIDCFIQTYQDFYKVLTAGYQVSIVKNKD